MHLKKKGSSKLYKKGKSYLRKPLFHANCSKCRGIPYRNNNIATAAEFEKALEMFSQKESA